MRIKTGAATAAENRELFTRLAAVPEAERPALIQEIWARNYPLVPRRALRLGGPAAGSRARYDLDDLISEGCLGLEHAIHKFQVGRDRAFSTYATFWIDQAIKRFVYQNLAPVAVPIHATLAVLNGTNRGNGMTVSPERIRAARQAMSPTEPLDEDRDFARSDQPSVPDLAATREAIAWLRAEIRRLPKKHRTMLRLRYGLDSQTPLTFRELGQRHGRTGEWASQICGQAIQLLTASSCQPMRTAREQESCA